MATVGWLLSCGHRKLRGVCVRAFAPEHPAVEVVRGHAAARHLVLHPVEEVRADLKRLHAEAAALSGGAAAERARAGLRLAEALQALWTQLTAQSARRG